LRLYRLTPAPSPLLPSANCLSFSVFLCVAGPAYRREMGGGGGEGGRGAESYERKKDWASINRSILSASRYGNIIPPDLISRPLFSKTAKTLLLIVCPTYKNARLCSQSCDPHAFSYDLSKDKTGRLSHFYCVLPLQSILLVEKD
jgi:hypothetical protein